MLNRDDGDTHGYGNIGKKQILIGIGIVIAIIVIVLVIVLPIVLTRKSNASGMTSILSLITTESALDNPTSSTTTPTIQSFITKCQSNIAKSKLDFILFCFDFFDRFS